MCNGVVKICDFMDYLSLLTSRYSFVTEKAYAKGSAHTVITGGGQLHTREGKRAIVKTDKNGTANFITQPDGRPLGSGQSERPFQGETLL